MHRPYLGGRKCPRGAVTQYIKLAAYCNEFSGTLQRGVAKEVRLRKLAPERLGAFLLPLDVRSRLCALSCLQP